MENLSPEEQRISDFIYNKPEVVVMMLNHHNYNISMDTATLSKINELVFKALYIDNNMDFAKDFDSAIANDGFLGFVMIAIAVVSAVVTAIMASDKAKKERALQKAISMANLSQNEALAMEELRADSETDRTKILTNSLLDYRNSLQLQSTIQLKDTWVYLLGLTVAGSLIYTIFLLSENK
jgi:hypothetical protein